MAGIDAIGREAAEAGSTDTGAEEHAFAAATERVGTQPFHYADTAPIEQMHTNDEIEKTTKRLQNRIADYAGDKNGQKVELPPPVHQGKFTLKRVPEKRKRAEWDKQNTAWTDRTDNAHGIANSILQSKTTAGAHAYKLGEEPVAVMKLKDEGEHTDITWLTTHPGVSGAGQTMVEKAANAAEQAGQDGRLKLTALDDTSAQFYRSVGFKGDKSGMSLDPSTSDLWEKQGSSWQLKKNDEKGYLAGSDRASLPPEE